MSAGPHAHGWTPLQRSGTNRSKSVAGTDWALELHQGPSIHEPFRAQARACGCGQVATVLPVVFAAVASAAGTGVAANVMAVGGPMEPV